MKTDKITWIFFIIILIGMIGGVFHILRLNIFIAKPIAPEIVHVVQKPTSPPVKKQKAEGRSRKSEVRSQKPETKNQLLRTLNPKPRTPNPVINKSPESIKIGQLKVTGSPARAKVLANGSLLVKSNPQGAIVELNGEEKGKTPLNIPGLKPWLPYQLQISLSKYYDWRATIFVEPGEEVKVEANLKARQEGFLYVTSIPGASAVYLDDELIGQTPLREWTLPSGDYTLKIIHEGYLAQTRKITVPPDEGVFINFELIKEEN